jgi:iron(III) transport system ATP-binding protein
MASLRIAGLAKSFGGHRVLSGVDLTVASGALVTILGASGSGKTTLLRLICGFERADAGTIEVDERTVSGPGLHVPPEQRRIGYVAQEGALFPHLTVADNIAFGLSRRLRRTHQRVAELLALVGLPASFAGRPPQALSGGEQQRVAVARALVGKPAILLADEPTGNLDSKNGEAVMQLLRELHREGATICMVTHDPRYANFAQRTVHLFDGRIVDETK